MKYCASCQKSYPNAHRNCPDDGDILYLKDSYGLTGRTIADKYRIEALIGVGGMSAVYSAYQLGIDRRVAFKMLLPHLAHGNEQMVGLFEREAKMAGRLIHENIATIFDTGRTPEDVAYITMEWIDGRTLEEELDEHGPLGLERTAFLLKQICAALEAAHARQIIHRDLKPSNIMLVRRASGLERVKVLDFGLAKAASDGSDLLVSSVMGTPHYASPEQFQVGAQIDGRTDIYSLGVLLYQMLAGQLPFTADKLNDLVRQHKYEPPEPIHRLRHDLPPTVGNLVHRMLAKDPQRRPQHAAEVAELFERAILDPDYDRDTDGLNGHATADPLATFIGQPAAQPRWSGADSMPNFSARHTGANRSAASKHPFSPAPAATGEARANADTAQSKPQPTGEAYFDRVQAPELRPDAVPPTVVLSLPSRSQRLLKWAAGHKLAAFLIPLLLLSVPAGLFFYNRPTLTEKDTVLVADFLNKTGDEVFDGALKQALAVQLSQTPFLNLFPDDSVRETMRFMKKSPDERLTREIGLEICQRRGLKAMLLGRIDKFERNYSITLEAINAQTGEAFAQTLAEAKGKDDVLRSLGQAAHDLRGKLGESLNSIKQFNAPIQQASTASLDALKAYSLGREQSHARNNLAEALSFYRRAVELDSNFALAYIAMAVLYSNQGRPDLSAENVTKAYLLRERVSEREKLTISSFYHMVVTGKIDKAIETLKILSSTYPRITSTHISLSVCYGRVGQFEAGVTAVDEAIRRDPLNPIAYLNKVELLMRLGKFDEAKATINLAGERKLDRPGYHHSLYQIAFRLGDQAGLQRELDWARGRADEHKLLDWQAQTAAFAGRLREAQAISQRVIDTALQRDNKETTAAYAVAAALRQVLAGRTEQAAANMRRAQEISEPSLTQFSLSQNPPLGLLVLALLGDTQAAAEYAALLEKRYPQNTLVQTIWLPVTRAASEWQQQRPEKAVSLLQAATPYEAGALFYPIWLRGQAYLQMKRGPEAAGEFQKIIDHRNWDGTSMLYPLAHLGLARAKIAEGKAEEGRKHYAEFFALWQDADADLPVLVEARKEFEKLK